MEHLPPWLRNVPLPPPPTDADETPDWLRGIDSFTPPPSTAAHTPDWLTESAEQAEAASIPDWLAELQAEVSDPLAGSGTPPPWISDVKPEPTAERPSAFGTADWLQGLESRSPAESSLSSEPPPTTTSRLRMPVGPTDWLRSMGHEEEVESAAQEPAAEEAYLDLDSGVPDWLRELSEEEITQALATTTPEPSLNVAEAETPSEPEMADWLSELDRLATDTKSPAPDWLPEGTANDETILATNEPEWLTLDQPLPPTPSALDLPPWLQNIAGDEPPAAPGSVRLDLPSWLLEEDVPSSPTVAPDASTLLADSNVMLPPSGAVDQDIPGWLKTEPPASVPESSADIPTWLRELESTEQAEQGATESEAPAWIQETEAPAAEAPDWLQEAEPPTSDVPAWLQEPSSSTVDTPDWLVTDAATEAVPWLEAASAQSGSVTEPPPTTSSTSDEFLSGADLPPWLRASSERVAEPAVTPSLSWLQRLGSREADEGEAVLAGAEVTVVKPPLPAPARRTSDQIAAVTLLEHLLQSPLPVTMPTEQPAVARRRLPVLEQWLALVLLLAILIGLLLPGLTGTLTNQVQPSPAAVALHDQLASLGSEDVVLIAYEWSAQRVAELRPLESALLAELTDERTKLIIVSTDLQGTLLSFDLIGPLRAAGYNNENGVTFGGRDYVLLGYRPGGELALRSLALDLRAELRRDYTGQDATAGLLATRPDGTPRIETLNDLAMIVVLADQVQDVQAWMEQIHSAAPTVPIAFLLPQEVYPQVLPYLRLPYVYAVAGQRGAIDLLAAGNADEKATYAYSYQTWATLVFIGVLVLGMLIVGIGRLFHLVRGKDRWILQ